MDEMKQIKARLELGEVIGKEFRGKSEVWKSFVMLEEKEEYVGYVKCKCCGALLKHERSLSGTSHLKVHLDVCGKKERAKQEKMSSFFSTKKDLSKSAKEKVLEASVSFVTDDLRPMRAVEGLGLRKLVDACIEIGAKHGKVDASRVLPSRLSVKRRITEKAKNVQSRLVQDLKNAVELYGIIGITTDMWTDMRSRHFVGLTAHFVSNSKLRSQIVTVYEFPDDKKTGANIRASIESACRLIGISASEINRHFCYVTDQGSNIKVALSNVNRLPCACHMLATVLKHALQLEGPSHTVHPLSPDDERMLFVETIKSTVAAVKSIVTYLKKSGKSNKLTTSVPQSNDTRWSSTFMMLKGFLGAEEEITKLLEAADETQRLREVDISVVNALLAFLEPYRDATVYLQGDSYPTVHRVFQYSEKLKRLMTVSESDCDVLRFLKERGLLCLQAKFEITRVHFLAFFLNPKFKSLIPLPQDQRQGVLDYASSLLELLISTRHGMITEKDHMYAPAKKKSATSIDDEFLEWQAEIPENESVSSKAKEVEAYSKFAFTDEFTNQFTNRSGQLDILAFWSHESITSKFPNLARLAVGVLSIPASSASSERAFSLCGNTLTKKRMSLSASTLDSLVILNSSSRA